MTCPGCGTTNTSGWCPELVSPVCVTPEMGWEATVPGASWVAGNDKGCDNKGGPPCQWEASAPNLLTGSDGSNTPC